MMPICLKMEGFGPYLERQQVEFSSFAPAGLFLIRGETGAGKTALLDAMTFALYGRSSGGTRGEFAAMRSLRADDDTPTSVELTFSLKGRVYRFSRTLRIRVKRGGGVAQTLEYTLAKQDRQGNWEPLFENPKQKDLEQMATALIGLDYSQFCQVMILPQGQFERMLTSKSEEKEQILVTLFRTVRWQEITDLINKRADNQKKTLEDQRGRIALLLDTQQCKTSEELEERVRESALELELQKERCHQTGALLTARRRVLEAERQLGLLFKQQEQARRFWAELEQAEPQWVMKLQDLRQSRRAAVLLPQREALERLRQDASERERQWKAGEAAYEKARKRKEAAAGSMEKLTAQKEAQEAHRGMAARLEALREPYGKLTQAGEALEKAEALRKSTQSAVLKLEQKLEVLERQKKAVWEEREEILASSVNLPALRASLEEQKRRNLLFAELEEARKACDLAGERVAACDKVHKKLEKESDAQEEALGRLEEEYLAHTAAILAQELREGDPCPVCGALHHPAAEGLKGQRTLQEASKSTSSESALEKARKAARKAREAFLRAAGELEEQLRLLAWNKTQRAELEARLSEWKSQLLADQEIHGDGAAFLQETEKRVEEIENKVATLPVLSQRMKELADGLERGQADKEGLTQKEREAQAAWERAKALQESLAARREEALPDTEALEKRIKELLSGVAFYEASLEKARREFASAEAGLESAQEYRQKAQEAWEKGKSQLEDNQRNFAQVLADNGFGEEDALRSAYRTQEELEEADRIIAAHRSTRETARRELELLEEQLKEKTPPELEKAEAEIACLEAEKTAQDGALGALREKNGAQVETLREVQRLAAGLPEAQEEYERLYGFSRMLRGSNGVSLQRYVLGVMLSAVTVEANALLAHVHGGRYRLYRTMEPSGGSRKAGLDLEVVDGNSGKRRGVSSLSGGEKFLVSLSLALGLSAVVQSQAGGIRMDAMFIDEGFGSLDPNSIDDALEVLSCVRGSRRLVGIISHVAKLKETVENSIEVRKGSKGSRLVLHTQEAVEENES